VDYDLDADQEALRGAVATVLARHAGPARAKALSSSEAIDDDLAGALADAGYLDLLGDPDAGPLAAELVVEWVAAAAGIVPVAARALVGPAVLDGQLPPTMTVMVEGDRGPVRFAQAEAVLVVGENDARLMRLAPGALEPVATMYGYPMARVSLAGAEVLDSGPAEQARRWWRVGLAAEIAGTMRAAFDLTLAYHKQREQFGRPIGSFQALQHRMSQVYVRCEGAAWLAREAAFHRAGGERAAAAAAYAAAAAGTVCAELHQMTGAIGFTREYDLHVWTLRLQTLRLELSGAGGHARALATARWVTPRPSSSGAGAAR